MKCPQCGLVTFDDLPACPRCKESFALVRPLATSSIDGARHMLRDDPDLRFKLRDRFHRARLDRRKNNDNPLAGSDPDAPDWFEPGIGGGNGAAEATWTPAPGTNEREEGRIVPIDDRSPDEDTRASGSSADDEADLIEASREADDADEPEFDGDVPGFTDWREELRERLKRIRARRKQEAEEEARRAADAAEKADEAGAADDAEAAEGAATEDGADLDETDAEESEDVAQATADDDEDGDEESDEDEDEATDEGEDDEESDENDEDEDDETDEDDEDEADEDEADEDDEEDEDDEDDEDEDDEVDVDEADVDEDDEEEIAAAEKGEDEDAVHDPDADEGDVATASTAKDIIARLVDGPGREPRTKGTRSPFADDVDFIIERDEIDEEENDEPEVLILGEKEAEPSTSRDDEAERELALVSDEEDETLDEEEDDDPTLELDEDDEEEEVETLDLDDEDDEGLVLELDDADEDEEQGGDEDEDEPIFRLDEDENDEDEIGDEEDVETADDIVDEPLAASGKAAKRPLGFDWGEAGIGAPTVEPGAAGDDEKAAPAAAGVGRADEAAAKPVIDEDADEAAGEREGGPGADDDAAEPSADADREAPRDAGAAEKEGRKPKLPPVVMPDKPERELDFEPPPRMQVGPELDLPAGARAETVGDGIEWDADSAAETAPQRSSAAPLGERAAASVCDALVLIAIGAALVGAASSGTEVPFRQILLQETVWLALAWAIFAVGYSIFLVGACGQTIGRMVMRLRVIGDDQFSVGFDRAAIRLAAWVVSALPILAGMLPALRDPQRRALHDRLSHTRVVKA